MAKKPTLTDTIKEIRMLSITLAEHANILSKQGQRINTLENWKLSEAAAKRAVDEYRRNHPEARGDFALNKDLIKILGIAIGAIVTLVGLLKLSQ